MAAEKRWPAPLYVASRTSTAASRRFSMSLALRHLGDRVRMVKHVVKWVRKRLDCGTRGGDDQRSRADLIRPPHAVQKSVPSSAAIDSGKA